LTEQSIVAHLRDEQMEFASAEWLTYLKKLFLARAATNPKTVDGVTCEVYRNPPAHLLPAGKSVLAWTRTIRNGIATVSFEECPNEDADVKLVADYDALLPLARFIVTEENEAAFIGAMDEAVREGRVTVVRETRSDQPRDYTIHNLIGALTR
jgi:hypothetical protein